MDLRDLLNDLEGSGTWDGASGFVGRSDIGVLTDDGGRTLLHHCAIAGDRAIDAANALLDSGADPVATDEGGRSPFDLAVSGGAVKLIRLFLSHGAPRTLHAAVMLRDVEAVNACLAADAGIDGEDADGLTPLTLAAGEGYPEVVQLLLAAGATPCPERLGPRGPLGRALNRTTASMLYDDTPRDYARVVRLLLDHGAPMTIWAASALGMADEVAGLLDEGADPAEPMDGFWNRLPLHYAALWGAARSAEVLIARGADVNALDMGWQTPLDLTREASHEPVAALLARHGGKSGGEVRGSGTP